MFFHRRIRAVFLGVFLALGLIGLCGFYRGLVRFRIPAERKSKVNLYKNYPYHPHFSIIIPFPSPAPSPQLDSIEVQWPKQMEVNSSGSIILVVRKRPSMIGPYTVDVLSDNSVQPSLSPSPVPTPAERLDYGSKTTSKVPVPFVTVWRTEDIYVTARLAGSNFNVTPITPERQQLSTGKAEWRWNVSPKQTGSQVINVSVEIEFSSTQRDSISKMEVKSKPISGGTVWLEELPVASYKSWLTMDSVTIGSLIMGLIGAAGAIGLTVPWLLDRFRQRKERKRQLRETIGFIK